MNKMTVRDIDLAGKRVLVRVDFNVPQSPADGAISDDSRIRAAIPTIEFLRSQKAKVILCSHLGRPDGKVVESMRLAPVARHLCGLLGVPVATAGDCIGPEVEEAVGRMQPGDVLMLENLRFHVEEEKNDAGFAKALARLADVYVNDAFGTAHRAHASTEGVAHYLPAVAGFLMEKELNFLSKALADPQRPFAAIIGGAKVSDKMGFLTNIQSKVDYLMIGGGMCCTFLKAQGYKVGRSLVEDDRLDFAKGLMEKAARRKSELLLPADVVIGDKFEKDASSRVVPIKEIPEGWLVLDIGPATVKTFAKELKKCRTVLWNGPLGVFEFPAFRKGTEGVAKTLAGLKATTILGGGSTAEAAAGLGLADKMTHVSTGGGATLQLLEGKPMPGVEILMDKKGQAGHARP